MEGSSRTRGAQPRLIAAALVWFVAVGGGMFALAAYKATPGSVGEASVLWPLDSPIQRSPGKATLIMAAHPKCACTRASLHELSRLLDVVGAGVDAHVLFVKPPGVDGRDWSETELWSQARSIEGVQVMLDDGGVEARRFNLRVSGDILLYDAGGRLLFHGGITSARGHEGDSFGRERILAILSGRPSDRQDSPTFGCALLSLGD